MWRGRGDLVPWVVGALLAIVTARLVPANGSSLLAGWAAASPGRWSNCEAAAMSVESLLAILGMAIVTFAIRAGGFLIAGRLPSTGWSRHGCVTFPAPCWPR